MLSHVRSIKTIPSLNKLISGPRTTNNSKKTNRQLHCITHEELINLKFPQRILVGNRAESTGSHYNSSELFLAAHSAAMAKEVCTGSSEAAWLQEGSAQSRADTCGYAFERSVGCRSVC